MFINITKQLLFDFYQYRIFYISKVSIFPQTFAKVLQS